jgi:hypothetical protein
MRTISASVDIAETDFQNLNRALKQRVESWG